MVSDFSSELKNCFENLKKGNLILYPTDTVWCIGCDATNEEAIQKIRSLTKKEDNEFLTCLVNNEAMLERFVEVVPEVAYDIIDLATKHTTIVYDRPKGFARNVITMGNSVAIRLTTDKFCQYLINKFRKPIVAISANISGQTLPNKFGQISNLILEGVDYTVNLHQEKKISSPSSIIKLSNDGTVKVIRE